MIKNTTKKKLTRVGAAFVNPPASTKDSMDRARYRIVSVAPSLHAPSHFHDTKTRLTRVRAYF